MRVTKKTPVKQYVKFIKRQFEEEEKKADSITIRGMGEAISKMTNIVEIIRHTVPGLYAITVIESIVMEDIYEPLEEGLDRLVFRRNVP